MDARALKGTLRQRFYDVFAAAGSASQLRRAKLDARIALDIGWRVREKPIPSVIRTRFLA